MTKSNVTKVLIANRGEIACRIIRSCKRSGLGSVAVYSEADAGLMHTELADEAVAIGAPKPAESYLDIDKVIAAAAQTGADAVHPGYGFLAENADFARAVVSAGLTWIGPTPASIEDMGVKDRARAIAKNAGLPVVPGSRAFAAGELGGLEAAAADVGYPLLVKATGGGGGIGMQIVTDASKLRVTVERTQGMAANLFANGAVYLERFVSRGRHVEVQVFGDGEGGAVHFYERDCSLQRRYQKVIEEARAPALDDSLRARMAEAAVALCRKTRYRGAGTVEFLLDVERGQFYFLEMNTRIQVEHPVTEMITGRDLVAMQMTLAGGVESRLEGEPAPVEGHSVECRIYAERPEKRFLPSPGVLSEFRLPELADDLRVETGYREGDKVTVYYDPLVAKLVAHGADRDAAIDRLTQALRDTRIEGIGNNVEFLLACLDHPRFRSGDVFTGFIDTHQAELLA